jgi:calcineurin-like phosphoesterase family protein
MSAPSVTLPATCLRVAVVSDLHVVRDNDEHESFLVMTPNASTANGNPFIDVLDLIERGTIRADLLLCPGDLGNRADPLAIQYGWEKLQELRKALHADQLIVSSGNHDLDSRRKFNPYDPLETLKGLVPRYPFASETESNRYWSHHFGAYEGEHCRVIAVNSAAYHWIEDEWEKGRIAVRTLEEIRRYLEARPAKPINILLCHHHPHRHPELRLPNSSLDVMVDGNHLTDMLAGGDFGEWLIVHGHKHHPYLSYASGSTTPPVVLSCGSFSAKLYKELQTIVRNQFYLVEFPLSNIDKYGLVGAVRAWDWAYGRGWDLASERHLSAVTPFGARESPSVYASKIVNLIEAGSYQTWIELAEKEPMLNFLPPDKAKLVYVILREKHGAKIEFEGHQPIQVSRP